MSNEPGNDAVATEVLGVLRGFAPNLGDTIPTQTPIGRGGLEFDSVRAVELLLACEDRFGVPFPESLLEATPLSVATLVDHVRRTRADET